MNKQELQETVKQALLEVPVDQKSINRTTNKIVKLTAVIQEKLSSDSTYFDFKAKIETAADLLGIDKKSLIKAAVKRPQLFYQPPEKFRDNIHELARILKISRTELIEAALEQPSLFYQLPKTINSNITGTAKLLGINKAEFVVAALIKPMLFGQLPETIAKNVENSSQILGVSKKAFIEAALKQPSLFSQLPETIKRNFDFIAAAHSRGHILSDNLVKGLLRKPALLTLAPNNTHLRSIDAQIHNKPKSLTSFFTATGSNKKQVEARVVDYFLDRQKKTGSGLRTLQILAKKGVISSTFG